jgi:hypothetical protein
VKKSLSDLIKNASQDASWISFSKKRQAELIEFMIKNKYSDAQIRKLFVEIQKSKLADQITLVGILIINEIEFDHKMKDSDLRNFIISKWDDLKTIMKKNGIDKSMIKNDQGDYRFSIKSLLVFASKDPKLIKYLIELAE